MSQFPLSPAIQITEQDRQAYVPATATSIGGYVCAGLNWGPVDQVTQVTSKTDLATKFGKPNDNNAAWWFSAANFLDYSNNLQLVRAVDATTFNATSGSSTVLVKNNADYESKSPLSASVGAWIAKYPGALGNSLRVVVCDATASATVYTSSSWLVGSSGTKFSDLFVRPATSTQATALGLTANDEVHVVVIDEDGSFTGTAGTVLEQYPFLSKAVDARNYDGSSNYYVSAINTKSNYVRWANKPSALATNWGTALTAIGSSYVTLSTVTASSLTGGTDPTLASYDASATTSWALFANSETTNCQLVISGPASSSTCTVIQALADARKDCVAFYSPAQTSVVNAADESTALSNVLTYFNSTFNVNSTYAVLDSNWKYQYDAYNDKYRWVPCNPDIAGLCARVDDTNDAWWSPAGETRGVIKNAVKLAWQPSRTSRDTLYPNRINPVVSLPGRGILLYGDKTAITKPGAFDSIGVRRLFLVLEAQIGKYAATNLFEFNDDFTRSRFVATISNYLDGVQAGRGILDKKVICDTTNNTNQIINARQFVGDIYIWPSKAINAIRLNFIATGGLVSFTELA